MKKNNPRTAESVPGQSQYHCPSTCINLATLPHITSPSPSRTQPAPVMLHLQAPNYHCSISQALYFCSWVFFFFFFSRFTLILSTRGQPVSTLQTPVRSWALFGSSTLFFNSVNAAKWNAFWELFKDGYENLDIFNICKLEESQL